MLKQYTLGLAGLFMASGLSAQWLSLTDGDGNDVTNSTVTHWEVSPGAEFTMVVHLDAEITDNSSRTVNVKRYEMGVTAGTKNYFCWGLCYLPRNAGQTPMWESTHPVDMDPGVPFTGFGGYHIPYGNFSQSCYRFVFFDVADPDAADSVYVDLCFETAVGIDGAVADDAWTLAPNPATDNSVVSVGAGLMADAIVVHNALGEQVLVDRTIATRRSIPLNTGTLGKGMYFVSIQREGRTLATQRLVVTR